MKLPPCIEDKCISFPVCIRKEELSCPILLDYLNELLNQTDDHSAVWDMMSIEFPNLERLGISWKKRNDLSNLIHPVVETSVLDIPSARTKTK
jgi:hypothetical protein